MSDSQVNFKVEKGMYWDITEFEGDQQEALSFIIPRLISNESFYLEPFLEDDPELTDSNGLFYQPSIAWSYIGVDLSGKVMLFESDYLQEDTVFTAKQSWDVFSKVITEQQPSSNLQSELEEAYAHIETLQEALEDAVKEILDLQQKNSVLLAASVTLTDKVVVDEYQFKPISEMTLKEWFTAIEEKWEFTTLNLQPVRVVSFKSHVGCVKCHVYHMIDGCEHCYELTTKDIIKRIK